MKKYLLRNILFVFILSATVILIYHKNINGYFFKDDFHFLYTTNAESTLHSFSGNFWDFKKTLPEQFYRPFQRVIFLLQINLFDRNYKYYAITNIFVHIINCLLLYYLCRRYNFTYFLSILTSFFFMSFSYNLQAIAWVSAFPDLYFNMFGLAALIINKKNIKSNIRYAISLLLIFSAMLIKETAIIYLFLLLLQNGLRKKQIWLPVVLLALYILAYLNAHNFIISELDYGNMSDLQNRIGELIKINFKNIICLLKAFNDFFYFKFLFYVFLIGSIIFRHRILSSRKKYLLYAIVLLYIPYSIIHIELRYNRYFYAFALFLSFYIFDSLNVIMKKSLRCRRYKKVIMLIFIILILLNTFKLKTNFNKLYETRLKFYKIQFLNAKKSLLEITDKKIVIINLDYNYWFTCIAEYLYFYRNKKLNPDLTIYDWLDNYYSFYWHSTFVDNNYYQFQTYFSYTNKNEYKKYKHYAIDSMGNLYETEE